MFNIVDIADARIWLDKANELYAAWLKEYKLVSEDVWKDYQLFGELADELTEVVCLRTAEENFKKHYRQRPDIFKKGKLDEARSKAAAKIRKQKRTGKKN